MKAPKFSLKTEEEKPKPNPKTLIDAVNILQEKVDDLSKRAENLLNLVASV